jgi:CTP:molybdopterin cytidylyltransferase MocA
MLDCGLWPVVVVVGKPVDEFRASLAGLPVATVANEALRGGQAGSLRLGLLRVAECAPAALGVVVVECERTVEVDHLCALAAAVQGRRDALAASSEGGRLGLPAFFPAAVFAELREMRAHERCADVLARHADEVQAVARP